MERFIKSIESSIESENWLAALFMALAMPDICRSVERPKIGKGETGKWYKDWVSRYLENKYTSGTHEQCRFYADDFWLYRCSCLHAGQDPENRKRMMQFNFTPPPRTNCQVHLNHLNGKLQLQIDVFCRDMIEAVNQWRTEVENTPEIKARMDSLINISLASFGTFIVFG
ncbi:hypothetical protein PR278_003971 [Escherichia coli]|uniref:hypothetical protein n=1 Tax=Escherichia coli TaxID=562 RepID=UPI0001DD2A7E|nr:hypothetical protein [Escherichia coli]EFH8488881.1 hypothetical protein [Escherichia coli]EFK75972.1 hypothetical protein HMPREF9535_00035 [Escherichia coli MS 78-1]EGJ5936015.1 hypothetical protein [Escherichia coli]EHH6721956.1 hypothetical protein [Escherichia coli]EHJ6810322.1 hypothetical protein [Escherichia coli]